MTREPLQLFEKYGNNEMEFGDLGVP